MAGLFVKFFSHFFLRRKADALTKALLNCLQSRQGEQEQRLFEQRVRLHTYAFLTTWKEMALKEHDLRLPESIAFFLHSILDDHVVDKDFPAYRTGGIFKNSFAPVKVLRLLAAHCMEKENAWEFLQRLSELAPDDHCHWAALAGSLLEAGKFREAADAALEARRIAEYDYCCSRIVNETQKALTANGLASDLPVSLTDNTDRFCDMPFLNLKYSTSLAGEEYISPTVCYSMAWLPIAFDHDFSWNGKDMQELRRSVLDGDFTYCDECRCPHMRDGTLPRKADITDPYLRDIIDNRMLIIEKGPQRLLFAYDVSCNISCPSCRPEIRMANAETVKALDVYMDKELPPLMPDVREITLSQSGEALASRHSLRLLKSWTPAKYPELEVELFTNMTLVSPNTWETLGESSGCIKKIFMSVDGATPATLEKLRRGLRWPQLIKGLEFVRELRQSGALKHVTLQLVLQKDNFRELCQLFDLASDYCIDTVMISKIESHGSYTAEEFHDLNIGDPRNPLFSDYTEAVANAKKYYAQMQCNKGSLEAKGKSVPKIIWRLF